MDATRPFNPNALLNRSPKIARELWITLEPADNTRNQELFSSVPDTICSQRFFSACQSKQCDPDRLQPRACVKIFLIIKLILPYLFLTFIAINFAPDLLKSGQFFFDFIFVYQSFMKNGWAAQCITFKLLFKVFPDRMISAVAPPTLEISV